MSKNKSFSPILLQWYEQNKRELPWRNTVDPYAIWLSEIILQQTRIDQGLAYYLRFIKAFPTIKEFAAASEDKILKLWQGLGYYSRARNMHITAKTIINEYNGKFPADYQKLLSLKGIGEYTASAIASIAFNLPYATVDGNVFRVLSRQFGIDTPINSSKGKKEFTILANQLLDKTQPGNFNQALMEFGAIYCTPRNAACDNCPINETCIAYKSNTVPAFPVKAGKVKIKTRYFNYFIIEHDNTTFLVKRTGNDIWRNLYEFPLVETKAETSLKQPLRIVQDIYFNQTQFLLKKETTWKKQVLSHQHIYYRFIYLEILNEKNIVRPLIEVNKKDIFNFAVPKPIEKELGTKNWF